jgi:hypothetical protein
MVAIREDVIAHRNFKVGSVALPSNPYACAGVSELFSDFCDRCWKSRPSDDQLRRTKCKFACNDSRDCQRSAWQAYHREECRLLCRPDTLLARWFVDSIDWTWRALDRTRCLFCFAYLLDGFLSQRAKKHPFCRMMPSFGMSAEFPPPFRKNQCLILGSRLVPSPLVLLGKS